MITVNQDKLDSIFAAYKDTFNAYIDQELFKWEALKQFQDSWDVNSEDFTQMLSKSFEKTEQLLASRNNFPKGQLLKFCSIDEDAVKAMFIELYDESKDLYERISSFIKKSDELLILCEGDKQHFQSLNSISTYLWLRYPQKYYIYKYAEIKNACELLESSFVPSRGLDKDIVYNWLEFEDKLTAYIKEDRELLADLELYLNDNCFKDDDYHTLAIDFIFFMKSYYDPTMTATHHWMYSPGPMASEWSDCIVNGAMYLPFDDLGDFSQYKSKGEIRKFMQNTKGTESNFNNDVLAVWEFLHKVKIGDIIYVKKGQSTLIARGIVEGDYFHDETRAQYTNCRTVRWIDTGEWQCEDKNPTKTLTDITPYKEYLERVESLFKVNNTSMSDKKSNGYWWLNANPKIWSAGTGWAVGEEQEYTLYNDKGNKRRIFQNFIDAKPGDKIICYESQPTKQIIGLAEISKASDGKTIGFVKIETFATPVDYADFKDLPELQNMEVLVNPNGSFFKVTEEEFEALMELIEERNSRTVVVTKADNYTEEDFLKEVFISKEDLNTLETLLKVKKNIILQGAPGVGKTFSAKRLAYKMMGKKDDSRIKYVQFHQNYSYEDFVMGYKPTATGFELKKGIFHEFCVTAGNDPDHDYFFIIDEINRGNLSKIFGELLMLIENSYRGQKVALAYTGELFTVPENLYIIGMMNTADRSLAMIDYALRRRFSFFKMKPGFESEGFKALLDRLVNNQFNKLISSIRELNHVICTDDSLGEGFEIGHSYFCTDDDTISNDRLKIIVEYDIIPTLEEYWFDNKSEVEKWSEILRKDVDD